MNVKYNKTQNNLKILKEVRKLKAKLNTTMSGNNRAYMMCICIFRIIFNYNADILNTQFITFLIANLMVFYQ